MAIKDKGKRAVVLATSAMLTLQLLGMAAPQALAETLDAQAEVTEAERETSTQATEEEAATEEAAREVAQRDGSALVGGSAASQPSAPADESEEGAETSGEPMAPGEEEVPEARATAEAESQAAAQAQAAEQASEATESDDPAAGDKKSDDKKSDDKKPANEQPSELEATPQALDPVTYVDESGATLTATEYAFVTEAYASEETPTLAEGTYVVAEDVTLNKCLRIAGAVTLVLTDGHTLTVEGVNNPVGSKLEVYGTAAEGGTLVSNAGDFQAGIGGGLHESAGEFVMHSGAVEATGGSLAAGIGGGSGYNKTAEGTDAAYANTDGGTVTILGGRVKAESTQGDAASGTYSSGAGIGGGGTFRGGTSTGGIVSISGGTVEAKGAANGAGIGGGAAMYGGATHGANLTISGGTVTATGGNNAAGIGAGFCFDSFVMSVGTVDISGGTVTAKAGGYGAGIGSGHVRKYNDAQAGATYSLDGGMIHISGGTVNAEGRGMGAAIGNGCISIDKVAYAGSEIVIEGTANVHAVANGSGSDSSCGAGIGGSQQSSEGVDNGTVTINAGHVVALGGRGSAGIGGSYAYDYARTSVVITGGEVEAVGGSQGAGIGGGQDTQNVSITISGGIVTATGGERATGIGSGFLGNVYGSGPKEGMNITISGGEISAIGGSEAPGIGLGFSQEDLKDLKVNINVTGGTVTAQAGSPGYFKHADAIGQSGQYHTYKVTLSLYDAAQVLHGEVADGEGATLSLAADRVADCRDFWAQISPCQHEGATCTPTDDHLHHTVTCSHCLAGTEGLTVELDHDFGETGECVCGVKAHRVSFDANGAGTEGSMATSDWVIEGKGYAIPACTFTRTGYDFAGWNTVAAPSVAEPGEPYADKATLTMGTANVTLYAQWTAHTYKVAFDKNGGTGEMGDQDLTYDAAPTALTACAFTRTGYDFAGWNTVAAPSEAEPGKSYADGQSVRNLTAEKGATVVLYAQWAAHTYKVAFNANAGDATGTMAEQDLAYGADTVALAKNAFSRKGYTFVGWNTVAVPSETEPGQTLADEQAVKNLTAKDGATVTLHAQWRANAYKVAFDANADDAAGTMAEQGLTYGADPVALSRNAFKRTGHSFAGWNTVADGRGDAYPDGARVADLTAEDMATVTLHAQWRANTYTVTFDPAGGSAVAAQKVTYGKQAKKPASPTKGAWTFGGWYADAALKSAYDFSRPVTGNLTLHAKWNRTSIAKATMAKVADQAYTAKAITPKPVVKLGSKTLKLNTDYVLSYKANVRAGTATVTATGRGAYVGSVSRTFRIVAPAGSATATLLDGRRSTAALGKTCGTVGKSMTMTSLAISLAMPFPVKGGIEYRTHVQTTGWEKGWKRNGAVAGNPKAKKRLEAVQIRLYGDMAKKYDVYYRAHVQRVGWMAWAKNGASAGTQSGSRRMEAVQVVLVPKGAKAPANTGASTKAVFVDYAKAKS
ncbi:MAG: InlB B-repeat-containing protein [Atopobiaceae bacterium]|nr:InlB B-repeat-containing protein [Atopobiaceae bacterium]